LRLSYNWHFNLENESQGRELFSVADFVGDACKAVASRVRGAVAGVPFDKFHKLSAKIIRASVFGVNEKGKIRDEFYFPANRLMITGIDIQAVEPTDSRTRSALQKSVQLAIEITTQSQEQSARQQAERLAQEAHGQLERQKIQDENKAEVERKNLTELRAETQSIKTTGHAKAEAQGLAEAKKIEAKSRVEVAKQNAKAQAIRSKAKLQILKMKQQGELTYIKQKNNLEATHQEKMSAIESKKFSDMIGAIGPDTIQAIATAGPALQAKLLSGLGIKSTLIMDGRNPLNLFSTAAGMVGSM